ncbi:RHS repeat-associated core domain-containing protein, partial [Pectobacterium parmentieri]
VTWGDSGKQEETRFLWEGFRLLQARQADRTETYLYDPTIWWSPLARITQQPGAPDGDIRWFNTELNGAPLEMTDAEGAVRWSGDYGSFGAINGQTQDSEGLRHGKPVESQSLRYAGQYADEETGLHYNLFRYYDPTVGRFTTQDPIGLAGGLNLYAYAPNPLGWVDPLGLAKILTDGVVYRMGSGTDSNLTPRPGKDTTTGLSTTIEKPSNGKYQTLDVKTLNDGGLDVVKDGKNHASVRPSNDPDMSRLREWADTRGTEKSSSYTKTVKKSCG